MTRPRQPSLPFAAAPAPRKRKNATSHAVTHAEANAESAALILAEASKYEGLPLEWAKRVASKGNA